MSLRGRLLLIASILIAVWVIAAIIIVVTQHELLVSQVDDQLRALPPGAFTNLAPPSSTFPGASDTDITANSPFSNIFVGIVTADGTTTTLFAGQLTADSPDFANAVDQLAGGTGVTTIDALSGSSQFRARVIPQPNSTGYLVAARSLTEVDTAITRLERTLAITGIVFVLVLGLAYLWIQRLGLRPIARVTEVAQAITAGDRSRRVPPVSTGTEAAQLGQAINMMLDERDASEERLRQFVADASHELRTPLTSVRGYLDLFQQGAFHQPDQLDDMIRRLSSEAVRMAGLVDDMLVLASLDEDRPLRIEPVDLAELLTDAALDARAIQPTRAITLTSVDKQVVVAGDRALLTQLVGILVSNALAHTPETAAVDLGVSATRDTVRLTVTDTGPGMEAEAARHVFDRFWRGEAGRTRNTPSAGPSGGSGLGLAIAQSIVQRHQGVISVNTTSGTGTCFQVDFPVATPASR